MVKLSGSISRKVPIAGIEFSSQSFSAGMEVEVSDGESSEVLKDRLRNLYALLGDAIDEQITAATHASAGNNGGNGSQPMPPNNWRRSTPAPQAPPPQAPPPAPAARSGYASNRAGRGNGNGGNGKRTGASEAQCRAIFAISKNLNLDLAAVLADFNVTDASQLSVRDASKLIDELKKHQAANPAPAQQ
jgi:hypothetical protein